MDKGELDVYQIKNSNGVIVFLNSGKSIDFEKTLTKNYNELINWLSSNDTFPFKVCYDNSKNEGKLNYFILYKNTIDLIEIIDVEKNS